MPVLGDFIFFIESTFGILILFIVVAVPLVCNSVLGTNVLIKNKKKSLLNLYFNDSI